MPTGHIAHDEAKEAAQCHHAPKVQLDNVRRVGHFAKFAGNKHQRKEEKARVQVVVHCQPPDGVSDGGQRFLGENGIQRNAKGRQNAIDDANDGQSAWGREGKLGI